MNKNLETALAHCQEATRLLMAFTRECLLAIVALAAIDVKKHRYLIHQYVDHAIDWWDGHRKGMLEEQEEILEEADKAIEAAPTHIQAFVDGAQLAMVGEWHRQVKDNEGKSRILVRNKDGDLPRGSVVPSKGGEYKHHWCFTGEFTLDGEPVNIPWGVDGGCMNEDRAECWFEE